ncbi:MAG TPA: DUF7694 domain-containing protein [Xylella sp.]
MQRLKTECGYADRYTCELHPAENDVVNVINRHHAWLLEKYRRLHGGMKHHMNDLLIAFNHTAKNTLSILMQQHSKAILKSVHGGIRQ